MTRAPLALSLITLLALPSAADARVRFFSEADLGSRFFLGSGSENAGIGPVFGVGAGVSFTSWLQLGVVAATSVHEATVPPPPDREYFQLYTGAADLRLGFRVGRVGIFAQGRAGLGIVSTNILDGVGITEPEKHWGLMFGAGGGLLYHTGNPRFAFGLGGDWATFPSFDGLSTVTVRVFLRYAR